jgi:predicted NAD-dependent protein-ADP-ribosyltransferase YbiA (DUF1768 family)
MRVILKDGLLALVAENEEERAQFAEWCESAENHVFHFRRESAEGGALADLGVREEACREPINVVYDNADRWQPISNLAETPFMFRRQNYASVEGFWQGLKFTSEGDRRRIAALSGQDAKRAGQGISQPESFSYDGKIFAAGGADHRALMLEACRAKFAQHLPARETLLATGDRPLMHRVRRDSKTIPGVVMAEIWMRIRAELRGRSELPD